jgi:hypothetical protein
LRTARRVTKHLIGGFISIVHSSSSPPLKPQIHPGQAHSSSFPPPYCIRPSNLTSLDISSILSFLIQVPQFLVDISFPAFEFQLPTTMSRVTPPITKLTRGVRRISSSAQAARPSALLDSHSHYLPRSIRDLKSECGNRELKTSGNKSEVCARHPKLISNC